MYHVSLQAILGHGFIVVDLIAWFIILQANASNAISMAVLLLLGLQAASFRDTALGTLVFALTYGCFRAAHYLLQTYADLALCAVAIILPVNATVRMISHYWERVPPCVPLPLSACVSHS